MARIRKSRARTILLIFALVVVVLLLPVVFKARGQPALVGPDLSELEYTEVSFENPQADIQMAGMLFLPEGEGPFPTAIIIHGSGTSRRNSVWYLSVAEYLQANGIAVLLPDKRGCEKSEGDWVGANFEELATDTLSAIAFVKNQEIFDYSTVGLIGMSQGGWIAPVVASKSDDVSFVVSMSGAAVTTDEQLLHEEIYNISPYTYSFIARLIAPITTNRIKQMDHVSAFMGFDPVPYWKDVQVPVFFAFGGNDTFVPVDTSIERLREYNLDHFYIKTFANGGHAIRDIQTNTVSGEYLEDLVRFIHESPRIASNSS
ncbi:MAG: alpha/beta fold hydrolase [Ardenticatenaceae bacterium]|nr:alpha/beta fold hydrolase [Ardenticatenaceae bacterium]